MLELASGTDFLNSSLSSHAQSHTKHLQPQLSDLDRSQNGDPDDSKTDAGNASQDDAAHSCQSMGVSRTRLLLWELPRRLQHAPKPSIVVEGSYLQPKSLIPCLCLASSTARIEFHTTSACSRTMTESDNGGRCVDTKASARYETVTDGPFLGNPDFSKSLHTLSVLHHDVWQPFLVNLGHVSDGSGKHETLTMTEILALTT